MRRALKEELENRFPWFFDELGFRIGEHDFSNKAMGSCFAVLESASLRVRFVKDPMTIYVEVASLAEPERWTELGFLWVVLTGDRPAPQLDGWAWFLRDHLPEIVEALGPRFEKTNQAVLQKERESQETVARYRALFQTTFMGIPTNFWRGPFGWIVAVILLIWVIAK